MPSLSIYFLLSLLIVAGNSVDNFYFHTTTFCRHNFRPDYKYWIQFYEKNFMPDELIDGWFEGEISSPSDVKTATYNGTLSSGLGEGDYYEIYAYIAHNCVLSNEETVYRKVLFDRNWCKIGGGDCHIFVTFDLTGLISDVKREVRIVQEAKT